MHKKFSSLQFIIGLFFLLIAVILLVGYFASALLNSPINLYAGAAFLLFGLLMMVLTPKTDAPD